MPTLPLEDRWVLQEAADKGSVLALTQISGVRSEAGHLRLFHLMVLERVGYLAKDGERRGTNAGDWLHVFRLTKDGETALRDHR